MKNLFDFKEEIHKCSKCGLCQAVCPLYKVTGNECTVSRGQFIMLDGVVKGKFKINKNINKYLDTCLKCGKCSEFCPSEIDVVQVLLSAKHEYFKQSLSGKIYSVLESKPVFNTLLMVVRFLSSLFCKKIKSKKFDRKVLWFGGCIEKFLPQQRNFVIKLLNSIGIEVLDVDFNCCGMPFLTTGNLERFEEQLIENIKQVPDDVQEIVFECASCEWAWKQYIKYVEDNELRSKLSNLEFINLYDLIAENDIKFLSKKHHNLTYHQPCHQNNIDAIKHIFNNCENIEYKEMCGYEECCGFSALEHPMSLKSVMPIIKKKIRNVSDLNVDFVITTCVGCLFNLSIFAKTKVRRLISFLKDNCDIK